MPSDVARFEWHQTTREMDSNPIKLEKHRGVYCLPGMVTETLNGVPLSSNPETASTAVEETVILATDPDTTTQLERSEETRKHKHKTLPRKVSRDRRDARQDAHLQIKSRSGKAVEQAHRPPADAHGGETKMGRDHFFLVRTAIPQHVKAVLNHSESGAESKVVW